MQGVATSTAKEIALGYAALNGVRKGQRLYEYLNEYLYQTTPKPCVITDGETVKDVCVYPYQTITGVVKNFDTLYKAENYYYSERERIKKFKAKKDRLTSVVSAAIKKSKKKLTAITAKERDADTAEENRIKGELILSNVYRIKQGDKDCMLDNYYDGSKMKIILDERLSPSKNAENYYKKYNKQKRTLIALKPQREQVETELNYLLAVLDEIELCEDLNELSLVQSELQAAGLIVEKQATNKKKKETESFCREYDVYGFRVRAGRNNAENDKLTFTARAEDIWVHAKDYHSSHVVIDCGGKEVPERVIRIAGEISAYYSKGRTGGKTEVVYTQKKNVKKPPKSKPGFCTYDNFKSVMVEPNKRNEFLKCD